MLTRSRQFPLSHRVEVTSDTEFELLRLRLSKIKRANMAIFLDRDGTLNYDRGYISNPDDIQLIPRADEAIKSLNRLGLSVIVITNQSALGRGILSQTELEAVNRRLWNMLQGSGAHYDALYYCPHNPIVLPSCFCRKPRPGMLYQAALDLELDPERCFMIGDKQTDVEAGKAAGCKTILIGQQHSGNDAQYSIAPDLFQSIPIIVENLRTSQHST